MKYRRSEYLTESAQPKAPSRISDPPSLYRFVKGKLIELITLAEHNVLQELSMFWTALYDYLYRLAK
jgi:hypothetical protein